MGSARTQKASGGRGSRHNPATTPLSPGPRRPSAPRCPPAGVREVDTRLEKEEMEQAVWTSQRQETGFFFFKMLSWYRDQVEMRLKIR